MNDDLLELNKLYWAWNIVNGDYSTPISRKISNLISEYLNESSIILELKKEDEFSYKTSFYSKIDLIIIYEINKLYDIPISYKGRVIIHSLEKINNNLLKRKGLEIIEQFEYTTVRKYKDIGLFLYHLESKPWFLKSSDITNQDLDLLYQNFKRDNYIMIAKYSTTLILEKKG
jgi:hypothetical protein